MQEAITLAEQSRGMTSPNPLVGAVVVKDGHIIGRGWHQQAGGPHAEVYALREAAANAAGAELYVTLEPCCTHGRTPPCTEAIIKAGIRKVFIGSVDPNPVHAGRGAAMLRDSEIEVVTGVEAVACDALNEAFFKWIVRKEPFVILKMAMTLDGKIATADGKSKWITGPLARQRVQYLRRWADAIMVGGRTARRDRPSLTVREPENWTRQPQRLIVSTSLTSELLQSMLPPGGQIRVIAPDSQSAWNELMRELGQENITALLIEGGGELAATVIHAGVVDKVEFHIAPKILGGRNSCPVVGGTDPTDLAEALNLQRVAVEHYGDTIAISGYPEKTVYN